MPDNPFAFWELAGMQIDRLGGTHFVLACFDSFPFLVLWSSRHYLGRKCKYTNGKLLFIGGKKCG